MKSTDLPRFIASAAIRFTCVAEKVRARDVVVNADLGTTEPGEVFLSHVSASAIEAVCLLMIDSLDLETLMQIVP